jgi:hypothetical protein
MSSLAVGSYKTTIGPKAFASVVSILLTYVPATKTQSIQLVKQTVLVLKPISEIQAQTPSYMVENPTDSAAEDSNTGGRKVIFSSSKPPRPILGLTQPLIQLVPGFFSNDKAVGE